MAMYMGAVPGQDMVAWLPALSLSVAILFAIVWHRTRHQGQRDMQCTGSPAVQTQAGGADLPLYASPCATRLKVAVKIYTAAGLSALPLDTATQLQKGCNPGDAANELQVLGMAAREGCVQLSVDVLHTASTTQATTTHAASSHHAAAPAAESSTILGLSQQPAGLDEAFRFLSALQPVLLHAHDVGTGHQLPHGLRVQVQVGLEVYQALWDTSGAGGRWDVQLAGSMIPATLPRPQLGLMYACNTGTGLRSSTARSTQPTTRLDSVSEVAPAHTTSIAVTNSRCGHQHGNHEHGEQQHAVCSFFLQVWDLQPGTHLQGWAPPSTPHTVQPADDQVVLSSNLAGDPNDMTDAAAQPGRAAEQQQGSYHLLVHCGGVYAETVVQPAQPHMLPERLVYTVLPERVQLVQVQVHLPPSLLLRHHQPEGPPTGLQALTFELWEQDQLLHAVCQVITLPDQHVQLRDQPITGMSRFRSITRPSVSAGRSAGAAAAGPAAAPTAAAAAFTASTTAAAAAAAAGQRASQRTVWWWGAMPCTVQHMMQEQQVLAGQLWVRGATLRPAELQAYQALCGDIATWLEAVKQGAAASGYCMAHTRHHAQVHSTLGSACGHADAASKLNAIPPIPPALAVHVGECLLRYAAAHQLPGLKVMVDQQLHEVVRGWEQAPTAAVCQHTQASLMWHCARGSILGFACHGCELQYKKQLSGQLATVQSINATFVALISVVGFLRALGSTPAIYVFLALVCMAIMQAVIIIQHARRHARRLPAQCSPLCVVSWCLRITYSWRAALRVMQPQMRAWYSGSGWVIIAAIRVLLSVNDQLTSSTFLSARWMVIMLALDGCGMFLTLVRVGAGQQPYWRFLLASAMWPCVVVLLLPRCLDMLSRYLLSAPALVPSVQQGKAAGWGHKHKWE